MKVYKVLRKAEEGVECFICTEDILKNLKGEIDKYELDYECECSSQSATIPDPEELEKFYKKVGCAPLIMGKLPEDEIDTPKLGWLPLGTRIAQDYSKNAPASPRPGDMYVDEEGNINFYTVEGEWAKFNSGLEDQIVSKVMDYIFAKYHTQEDPSPIEKELHELLVEYQPFQARLRAQEMLTRNEK